MRSRNRRRLQLRTLQPMPGPGPSAADRGRRRSDGRGRWPVGFEVPNPQTDLVGGHQGWQIDQLHLKVAKHVAQMNTHAEATGCESVIPELISDHEPSARHPTKPASHGEPSRAQPKPGQQSPVCSPSPCHIRRSRRGAVG
jgi:hypothetical protein